MLDYYGSSAMIGWVLALVLYVGLTALSMWIFYLIIRTAVKNGILRADEARRPTFR